MTLIDIMINRPRIINVEQKPRKYSSSPSFPNISCNSFIPFSFTDADETSISCVSVANFAGIGRNSGTDADKAAPSSASLAP